MQHRKIPYTKANGEVVFYHYDLSLRHTVDWNNDEKARQRFALMYSQPDRYTLADIGNRFHVTQNYVSHLARRFNLPKRKQGSGCWRNM